MTNSVLSRLSYPNPFKPTGIEVDLPSAAVITVAILDGLGNILETIIDQQHVIAGKHHVPLDTAKYASGPYWYQLSAQMGGETFVETREVR